MAFQPGFVASEAEDLIAVLANFGKTIPPLTQPALPAGWNLLFDSGEFGPFDDRWQLWQTQVAGQFAIAVGGTVPRVGSVIEDLLLVMIPAAGSVTLGPLALPYQFATDPEATIHLGFTLGSLILLLDPDKGILVHLFEKVPAGSAVFVSGHSQGAAEATLIRSFLAYYLSSAYQYKTYVFAQPKPGNDHYATDFEAVAANAGLGFRVTNDQDWVPQVPLTIELPGNINQPNPISVLKTELLGGLFEKLALDITGVDRFAHHLAALADLAPRQNKIATTPVAAPASGASANGVTLAKTLNYVGAGWEIALQGTPGSNPLDPKDFFWQHHTEMYFDLLQKQFP